MDIYLPIAEMSVNLFLLLGIGGVVGFLSGLFGVGGGFLLTPLLIFIGVPAPIAVGSGTMQILASSVSGMLAHLRRRTIDLRMGLVLVLGGFTGSGLGILIFRWLRQIGQIDTFITVSYVLLLGTIGTMMLVEGGSAILRRRRSPGRRRPHRHWWAHGLPLKLRFPKSKLYISSLIPFTIGCGVGILTAVMGVGGGFILLPAMIYLIGMPTSVVVGTSLLQLCFVSGLSGFLHAYTNQTVDIVLALIMILGGVVGAQFGARAGTYLRGDQLRLLLGILVLSVGVKLAYDLVVPPLDPYNLAS